MARWWNGNLYFGIRCKFDPDTPPVIGSKKNHDPAIWQGEHLELLIETDKIATVIDPKASFTLEYLDMIMTIRANAWKALFVPTARLEFRITEFSTRDIPCAPRGFRTRAR